VLFKIVNSDNNVQVNGPSSQRRHTNSDRSDAVDKTNYIAPLLDDEN